MCAMLYSILKMTLLPITNSLNLAMSAIASFFFLGKTTCIGKEFGTSIQLAAKLVDSGSGATLPEIVDIYFANDDVPFLDAAAWDQ